MPFKLEEVTSDGDFDDIIACLWESFYNPFQSFFPLFCPVVGTGPNAYAESIETSTDRYRNWHKSDPTSHWLKVIDTDTGDIAAAAQWNICDKNPFEGENEPTEAFWHPEGTQREFMTKAMEIFEAPREKMMAKPQVCKLGLRSSLDIFSDLYLSALSILFTLPRYRGKGAGTLLMEWGIQKGDEMGVEMWVDATEFGRHLYEKYGFVVVHDGILAPTTENPNSEWLELQQAFSTTHQWHLWRPVGGVLKPGEPIPSLASG